MTSPSKVKETSLSQFYRKLQYHQQSMNLNESDPNIFSKIHSSPQSKIHSQYSELDLQSNMKKDQKMFLQRLKNHNSHNSPKKSTPQVKRSQQNLFAKDKQESQINKNDETSFDYNLSVEPQQIQIPQVQKKYSVGSNQRQIQKQKDGIKVQAAPKTNVLTLQKQKTIKKIQNKKFQQQYSDVVERLKWEESQKVNSQNSNISNIQEIKTSQHQISSPILSSDDEQGSDIFLKCNQLQSKIQSLKQQKYQFAIQKYRSECQKQMQKQFQIQKNKIDTAHASKVLNIQNGFQAQRGRFQKAKQDLNRYKQTYEIILTELNEKKNKILQEFEQSLQKVKSYEQKSIIEWKRQSNQQIKKILNQKTLMF